LAGKPWFVAEERWSLADASAGPWTSLDSESVSKVCRRTRSAGCQGVALAGASRWNGPVPRRRSWLWRAGHVHAGHRAAHEGPDVQVLPLSGRRVRDDHMRRLVYPSRTRAELGSGLLHQGLRPRGRGVPAHRRGSRRRFRRRALRRRITSAPSACSCPLLVATSGEAHRPWPKTRNAAGGLIADSAGHTATALCPTGAVVSESSRQCCV
jgi:hypothetical protein